MYPFFISIHKACSIVFGCDSGPPRLHLSGDADRPPNCDGEQDAPEGHQVLPKGDAGHAGGSDSFSPRPFVGFFIFDFL